MFFHPLIRDTLIEISSLVIFNLNLRHSQNSDTKALQEKEAKKKEAAAAAGGGQTKK